MITALAPDFSLFARRSLVTLPDRKPENIIDPARLALALREKFYARTPPKLPECDRCNEREATVFAGAINYCQVCWDRLGSGPLCVSCEETVTDPATHPCTERP